jgi:transposase
LHLGLSKPQQRHVLAITDALIVCDTPHKTLTTLYKSIVDAPDPSNGADFLRISPWDEGEIDEAMRQFTVDDLFASLDEEGQKPLFVHIDDSLGEKDAQTKRLEAVDWHHDHTKSTGKKQVYTNGTQHIEVQLQLGNRRYVYATQLYLREKTVRRLNRNRAKAKRIPFRSKYRLVLAILKDLKKRLPKGHPVYVQFDSWYASNDLLKFCRRQGWHVMCAIKSNRTLNGKKLTDWNQRLKHQPYKRITVSATDQRQRTYLVRALTGRLKNVPFEVCVLISKRHRGDKRPKYFLCTDLRLSPHQMLNFYQKRWSIEVDNYYVKQLLGLADFRVHSYEATQKWFRLVFLAYTFLQWRLHHAQPHERFGVVADVIRDHRQQHTRRVLEEVCERTASGERVEAILHTFVG